MELNFSPKAWSTVVQSIFRINIWEGAVRSGKTIASIVRWIIFVRTAPPGELLMVGKTERTLKRNILDEMEKIVGTKHYSYKQGSGEVWLYGRRIYVAGANDERAEGKIRGMTLAGAYGDEVTLWPEGFFKQMLLRMSVEGAMCFVTTNPDSPYHWLKVDYIDKEGIAQVFHFELEDNPNLPKAYIEALKREYTGLWYKRFILGLWVLAEGAVYDMWDEAKHVFRCKHQRYKHYFVAVDYGTHNPCTFGLYGYNKVDEETGLPDKVRLIKEYYWDSVKKGRQKTDAQYADDLEDFIDGCYVEDVYIDPSAASFKLEVEKRGIHVVSAINDVIDGIRYVSMLLTLGIFEIDESCTSTIKEFSAYVWDAKSQIKGVDEPVKEHDHAMDRNRYGLYTRFGKFLQWTASWDNL